MNLSVEIRHRFAGFDVAISFEAPLGVTALFGPSGAGKSTVLNAVAGLLRPDHARITLGGRVLTDTAKGVFCPPHRRRLGVIFQDGRLFPHLNVRQNLRYGRWFLPRGTGHPTSESMVIDMLGIGALLDRSPATLSGGERQRVAIGRALLAEPDLLLADEPLSALDQDRKAEILPYLERLRDEFQVPMLYVSHSAAEIARIATTVALLAKGRLTRIGPAAEIFSDPALARALSPGTGDEAGAMLCARVRRHHADGLTELDANGQALFVSRIDAEPGASLRLRIAASDVMLACTQPEGLSALNILPGTVESVHDQSATVLVRLATLAGPVLAHITSRSAARLGVQPGARMTAIIKTLSHHAEDIGAPARPTSGGGDVDHVAQPGTVRINR